MITYSFIIRKGVIIKNIQTTSGAKLITTIDDPKSDLFTGIVIMASLRNALYAHKNIYDIVQETDDLVLEFPFYEKKYKFLTGEKGFNTLRKLSADTNVRIFIPNTENSMLLDGKYSNDASFEGTYPNICKAIELIESHYKKRERDPINNSLLAANPVALAATNIHNGISAGVAAPVQQPAMVHSNSVNNINHQDKNSKVAKVKGPPAKDPNETSASVNTTNVRSSKEKLKNTTSESSEKKTPNSKNKERSKDEQTVNTEVTEVKEVAEVKELVKLERIIEIPSNIVGIFLARPKSSNTYSSKISVVNQIQKYTRTTISLIDPPPARVKPAETIADSVEKPVSSTTKESTSGSNENEFSSSRRRSDNDEESGSDDEDDNSDGLADDEEVEEEDEVEEGGDNEVDEKVEATETSNKDTIAVVSEKEIQPITMVRFTVSNQRGISRDSIDPLCTQANIDLACTAITRMINGERIKDVLAIFSSSPYKNNKGKEVGGKNVRPKKFNNSQNNDSDNKKKTHNHSNKDKSSPKKDAQIQKNTQKEMPK